MFWVFSPRLRRNFGGVGIWFSTSFFFLILMAGGYWGWRYFFTPSVPPEFTEARQSIALFSAELVDLTFTTNYKIKDINYLDLDGHYDGALALVQKARDENRKAFDSAVELSNQLRRMTEALPEIRSAEARQLSQEAIALEMALIIHFINYTKAMDDLLRLLNSKLVTPTGRYQREIDIKLSEINAQVLLVNNLNQQFLEKMAELDRVL